MPFRYKSLVRVIAGLLAAIVVILLGLKFVGFELSDYPPDRPASVPNEAEWAGGPDVYNGARLTKMEYSYGDGRSIGLTNGFVLKPWVQTHERE